MAQINKPSLHFNTKLYTGNGSNGHAITGVGFQPDWVWLKNRSGATSHVLVDAIRGNNKVLSSNNSGAETTTNANKDFRSFDSDGFTVDTNENFGSTNTNGANIASWNWKANGTGSANTSGSINSTVSVNTTAGFSVVKWTGDNNSTGTIGHGLGVAPSFYVVKRLDSGDNWYGYWKPLGNTKVMYWDLTNAASGASSNYWNNTDPTTTVFSFGAAFQSTGNYVAYCFAEKKGYLKVGSYPGTGNANGPFIYTGFKPAWLMVKGYAGSDDWIMMDNKRSGFNSENEYLDTNNATAESDGSGNIDFLSNGFKLKSSFSSLNHSSGQYIYMAIAENPIVGTNNIPATAR